MLDNHKTGVLINASDMHQKHVEANRAMSVLEDLRLAAVEVLGLTAEDLQPIKVTTKKVYR